MSYYDFKEATLIKLVDMLLLGSTAKGFCWILRKFFDFFWKRMNNHLLLTSCEVYNFEHSFVSKVDHGLRIEWERRCGMNIKIGKGNMMRYEGGRK